MAESWADRWGYPWVVERVDRSVDARAGLMVYLLVV